MYYREEVLGELPKDELRGRIPLAQCKTRRLYRVDTRNFGPIAVFDAESQNGFYGLRRKFNAVRLDVEYHFQNEAFNTAIPWEELPEELPAEIELRYGLGSVCKRCHVACEYARWPEGGEREIRLKSGETMRVPGQWRHLADTQCDDCFAIGVPNTPLYAWLKEMEKRYWWPAGERPEWINESEDGT